VTPSQVSGLPAGTVVEWDGDLFTAGDVEVHNGVKMRWRNEHIVASDRYVSWIIGYGAQIRDASMTR
jgi:hypothetical protein